MAVGKLKVIYRLSTEGKRRMLLHGKEAQPVQEIVFDLEMTDNLLLMSMVDSEGVAKINLADPVSVGGFFSVKHPPLDEPIFTPEQALAQMALFRVEMDKAMVKSRAREEEFRLGQEEKARRHHKNVVDYARRKTVILERKYGTLVWLAIKDFDSPDRDAFDKMVKEFVTDCERKDLIRKKEKAEAEKRQWIQDHGSERLRSEYEAGVPCQPRYVRERVLTEIGLGWYIDPMREFTREPASMHSGTAVQVMETLRLAGMNPSVVWLPEGITRGEPPEDEGDTGSAPAETDEFQTYDDPAHLPALGGCEAILLENYLGRYDLYYPVGPKALTEGLARIERQARWLKKE